MRLAVGLLMTAVAFWLAGRRVLTLVRLGRSGQPVEPGRTSGAGARVRAEVVEVLLQRKLLKWTVPGIAHVLAFWGFLLLMLTVLESYGALFDRDFHLPFIGTAAWLGFLEDTVVVLVLVSVVIFAVIRLVHSPQREGRRSRFFGSHLDMAWLVLFMIFNVVWSLLLYRGAQVNAGVFPFPHGAFASDWVAGLLEPLGKDANEVIETVGILLALGIILTFLVLVVHSKHLHIITAVFNVAFSRRPRALGALLPVHSDGKPVDFEDPGETDLMGRGKVEDFTWKGLLDFATCTECGRCQSQCPAWNTDKPLSPKLLIMNLRDHALAKAPYLLAGSEQERADLTEAERAEAERPLVGALAEGGVIDPDVLWSCTTCGACVEQCPVDIEHIDHIVDMRRCQVLVEGQFPEAANPMLVNLEHAGDPWGLGSGARMEWAADLPFEVPVVGADGAERIPDDVEYLFWVGCAGALDDKAQRTSRAVAQLLHDAGVSFMVLGEAETCTGDPARRLGHEFLFQMLAQQNVETLNSVGRAHHRRDLRPLLQHPRQRVPPARRALRGRPPHPAAGQAGGRRRDPPGRARRRGDHLPRPLLPRPAQPGLRAAPRHPRQHPGSSRRRDAARPRSGPSAAAPAVRGCGWTRRSGQRINENRTDEALSLQPDIVTAACPFCIVMLTDGMNLRQQQGQASEAIEVLDVSEVLLRSMRVADTISSPVEGLLP